jgi:hypothetical protein
MEKIEDAIENNKRLVVQVIIWIRFKIGDRLDHRLVNAVLNVRIHS